MDKYYKSFSSFLINNDFIKADDSELYEYAAKVVIHGIINIVITILIGVFMGMIRQCLALFVTFFILRKFTGGLHAEKYAVCLLSSSFLMAIALLVIRMLENRSLRISVIATVCVSILVIILFSPVDNKNKRLNQREKKIYWKISVALSVVALIITMILLLLQMKIGYSIGVGVVLTSALVLCGKLKSKMSKA